MSGVVGSLKPIPNCDYATGVQARQAWEDGEEFVCLSPGHELHEKTCTIDDFDEGDLLNLRYYRMTKTVVVEA